MGLGYNHIYPSAVGICHLGWKSSHFPLSVIVAKWRFSLAIPSLDMQCHPGGDDRILVGLDPMYINRNIKKSHTFNPLVTSAQTLKLDLRDLWSYPPGNEETYPTVHGKRKFNHRLNKVPAWKGIFLSTQQGIGSILPVFNKWMIFSFLKVKTSGVVL